jgi:hypothetical protein
MSESVSERERRFDEKLFALTFSPFTFHFSLKQQFQLRGQKILWQSK